MSEPEVRRHLADQLRALGCHGRLSAQARAKQAALAREGRSAAELAAELAADDADEPDAAAALWRWYFEGRLGRPVPDDLAAYAARFGFDDEAALRRAVQLERWSATAPAAAVTHR